MATAPIRLRLKPEREKPLLQGHPWLFSGAIAAEEGPPDAALALIVAADGRELGLGFHSPRSQIRARLPGVGVRAADRPFFAGRLRDALDLRAALVPQDTTGYRVLNAEGDGLPGWTIDRFGDVLVSQIAVYGLETLRAEAYAALLDALPASAILQSNGLPARRLEGLGTDDEWISGEARLEAVFTEAGLRFTADLSAGQKTGFYCDQRDNRRLVASLAQGRGLLDLFAHSGAFGVHAVAGGADRVVHIESSPPLAERGRRHYEMNGLDPSRVEWVRTDVFEDLRRRADRYDLVVCDPPPLARRRGDVERAARAYKDVNRLAMQRLAPGGFMLTFSCSGSIDGTLFRQILFAAALEAGARVQLLRPLAAALDHPVAMSHREGEYLKGWLLRRHGEAAV